MKSKIGFRREYIIGWWKEVKGRAGGTYEQSMIHIWTFQGVSTFILKDTDRII